MRIGIMQPYFFPYIGYFQLMAATDRFIVYDRTRFTKPSWMTRNRIARKDPPHFAFVGLPAQIRSGGALVCDAAIVDDGWDRKLLATIEVTYRRARHFDETMALLRAVVPPRESSLAAYNTRTLEAVASHLGIVTPVVLDSTRHPACEQAAAAETDADRRRLRRITTLCSIEGADEYVNLPGGRALYAPAEFEAEGVRLRFLAPVETRYRQFGEHFEPGLSIIDVLMHTGRESAASIVAEAQVLA